MSAAASSSSSLSSALLKIAALSKTPSSSTVTKAATAAAAAATGATKGVTQSPTLLSAPPITFDNDKKEEKKERGWLLFGLEVFGKFVKEYLMKPPPPPPSSSLSSSSSSSSFSDSKGFELELRLGRISNDHKFESEVHESDWKLLESKFREAKRFTSQTHMIIKDYYEPELVKFTKNRIRETTTLKLKGNKKVETESIVYEHCTKTKIAQQDFHIFPHEICLRASLARESTTPLTTQQGQAAIKKQQVALASTTERISYLCKCLRTNVDMRIDFSKVSIENNNVRYEVEIEWLQRLSKDSSLVLWVDCCDDILSLFWPHSENYPIYILDARSISNPLSQSFSSSITSPSSSSSLSTTGPTHHQGVLRTFSLLPRSPIPTTFPLYQKY